jgi:hypothetical protein
MNPRRLFAAAFAMVLCLSAASDRTPAQQSAKREKKQSVAPAATANPVIGAGTPGRLSKWAGIEGTSTYSLGDANIFEDKFGKIGIGTPTPTSLLTVQGMIETTLGGYKFPDGTLQTTAGIAFVTHDASLMGDGRSASPLGIALGGVNTPHLGNGAVTAPKIANGTVVRSFNGLFDNVLLVAGSNISITPAGNTLLIAAPDSLSAVAHNTTLTGNGTTASPLSVASGGIGTAQLADGAVTLSKIAIGQVVTKLNNLTESVTLAAGPNITITPSGNTLTIAGAGSSSTAYHAASDASLLLDSPGRDVISKQVPAGSYIIFFKVGLFNDDDSPQDVSCTLSTGDSVTIRLAEVREAHAGIMALQDAATFPAPATITVHCTGFQVFTTGKIILTALKVGAIQ